MGLCAMETSEGPTEVQGPHKPGKIAHIDLLNTPMPKARQQVAPFGGTPDDVEATFYEALQSADIEKLMSCWADDEDILCIHPGGPRVVGALAIRAAFDAIFGHEGSIQVQAESIRRMASMASAVHNVLERIQVMTSEGPAHAFVLATNVYHQTPRGWRLVVHHASPGTQDDVQEIHHSSQVLH
jgi:ketosteroid isomerase-like protein